MVVLPFSFSLQRSGALTATDDAQVKPAEAPHCGKGTVMFTLEQSFRGKSHCPRSRYADDTTQSDASSDDYDGLVANPCSTVILNL